MAIRKRITDPYGAETKEFERRMREGRRPKAPAPPDAKARKPIQTAFDRIEVNKIMSLDEWHNKYVLPCLRRQFDFFGVRLAIYPTQVRTIQNKEKCTGCMIMLLTKNRRGQRKVLDLRPWDKSVWYGMLLQWIKENCYDD
jgi:hypothetical protein